MSFYGGANLPDLEAVADRVHESWMFHKRVQGTYSHKSEDGEELMVPYEQLSEKQKESDRATVRTVWDAMEQLSESPHNEGGTH